MGGVSPETCWASYKYEIKFWYTVACCWISYVKVIILKKKNHIPGGNNCQQTASSATNQYRSTELHLQTSDLKLCLCSTVLLISSCLSESLPVHNTHRQWNCYIHVSLKGFDVQKWTNGTVNCRNCGEDCEISLSNILRCVCYVMLCMLCCYVMYVMLCMLCYAMLCYVMCYVMLCYYGMLCMLCYVMLRMFGYVMNVMLCYSSIICKLHYNSQASMTTTKLKSINYKLVNPTALSFRQNQ
jgi:hypothetical protein